MRTTLGCQQFANRFINQRIEHFRARFMAPHHICGVWFDYMTKLISAASRSQCQ
jgi:hypothetical protein